MHSLAEIRRPRTRRKLGPQRLDDLLGSQAMLGASATSAAAHQAAMGQHTSNNEVHKRDEQGGSS